MSTGLENKLNQILTEKETYLTSGNIKKDVTILGVTGTLEGVKGEEINITPTTSQQVITPTTGKNAITKATVSAVTSSIDANIVQSNIKAGVTILGVTGNVEPDKPDQTKTCTPTTSQQVIQPDTGYELASVTVNGVTSAIDSNITAGNIKSGVTILGVNGSLTPGTDTSDATLSSGASMLSGNTAYANGVKYTGSMVNRGTKTFTPSASSQSASAGYYSSITCNAVSNLSASNIKKGASVGGITGTFPTSVKESKKAGETLSAGNFLTRDINNVFSTSTNGTSIASSLAVSSYDIIDSVALNFNKSFVIYRKSGGTYGIVCDINETTVTKGTEVLLSSSTASYPQNTISVLSSSSVFVTFRGSSGISCMVCTISGTTITKGTEKTLTTHWNSRVSGNYFSSTTISNNKVAVAFYYSSALYGVICDISGTTITIGTEYNLVTPTGLTVQRLKPAITKLYDDKFFVAYKVDNYLYGSVCTVNETVITAGTYLQLDNTTTVESISATTLSENEVIATFISSTAVYYMNIYIENRDIKYKSSIKTIDTVTSGSAYWIKVVKLSTKSIYVIWSSNYTINHTWIVFKADSTESYSTTFTSLTTNQSCDCSFMGLGKIVAFYINSSSLYAKPITIGNLVKIKYVEDIIDGIADASITNGSSGNIHIPSI